MLFRLVMVAMGVRCANMAPAQVLEFHNPQLEGQVDALFQGDRDFSKIKLTIDRIASPRVDVAASLNVIDDMAAEMERMKAQAGAVSDFEAFPLKLPPDLANSIDTKIFLEDTA